MSVALRIVWVPLAALAVVQLGGCPTSEPVEYIAGGTGSAIVLRDPPEVNVLTPVSALSLTGGTQVEVNWSAFARTRTSVLNVIIDEDQVIDNGNETVAYANLSLEETSALVDTTDLAQGTYYIAVAIEEVGELVASDYAPGSVTIDQRPYLYFTEPRGNLALDRSESIVASFEVAWVLEDPDSVNTTEIFLDPDDIPNGNEVFLFTSDSQTGDSFEFDIPTSEFEPGVWRILAQVSDGQNTFPFYAPASLRLRARIAGYYDLRNLDIPDSLVQGCTFEGFNPHDNAGSLVTSLGDLDADGFNDFLILSQFGKPRYEYNYQRTGIGESYLIYGRGERFAGKVNLNSTGTLYRGEVWTGIPEAPDPVRPSRGITSFALQSDWDSDGVRELAFGLPFTDSIRGEDGWILDQNGYFRTGGVVVAAGSVLRPDLGFPGRNVLELNDIGTAPHMPRTDANCPEGFYGPKSPNANSDSTFFHQHLYDYAGTPSEGGATLGCRFSSAVFGDEFGEAITSWDFDAIVMSSPNRDPFVSCRNATESVPGAGVISIFYVDVRDGFYPWCNDNAPPANNDLGYPGSVQSAGDRLLPHGGPYHYVIDDLVYNPGYTVDPDDGDPCGRAVDGHITTPENSLRLWSSQPGARLSGAKNIGDFSADGLLDLLVGAPFADNGAGACYILFGRLRDLVRRGELRVEDFAEPMTGNARLFDGVRIVGSPGERLGQSQDDAGDFNNDGYGDIVIGSPLLNDAQGGAAVFYGSREVINLTETEIPFSEIPARGLGVIFVGEEFGDLAGARVASAGDIDGDGNDDILIAAPNRSVRLDLDLDGNIDVDRENCGVVYLVYGAPDLNQRRTPGGDPGVLSLKYIGTEDLPGVAYIGQESGDYLGAGLGDQADRSTGIAGLGDIDGDGTGDLLFGSVSASPRGGRLRAGEAYLIYGIGD